MNVIINDGYTSVSCCFSWQEGGRDFPCSIIGWICEAKLCTQVNLTIHTACHIFILMHHLKGASFLYILQTCPCCILFPPSDEVRLYTSTSHICDSMWRHFIHTRRYVRTKFTMGYFSIIDMDHIQRAIYVSLAAMCHVLPILLFLQLTLLMKIKC